jgi:hypothetical protein
VCCADVDLDVLQRADVRHGTRTCACAYTPFARRLFLNWGISIDVNHNAWMLQLARFDGALLPRLYLKYRPPEMNPSAWRAPPSLRSSGSPLRRTAQQLVANSTAPTVPSRQ